MITSDTSENSVVLFQSDFNGGLGETAMAKIAG